MKIWISHKSNFNRSALVQYENKKHITDYLLRQREFDQLLSKEYGCYRKGTSNEELMKEHGFVEVYDAGQATYVWNASW